QEGRLVLLPVERVLAGEGKRYTQKEIAEKSGMDLDLLKRIWRALGMAQPDDDRSIFTESDLEAAKNSKEFLDAGIPEEELLQLSRSMGQSMSNVAAAVGSAFAEALIEPGDTEAELALRYADATRELVPRLEETVRHVLRMQLRERARSAVITSTELSSGKLAGSQQLAVGFADLVDFTKLGERIASEELGDVAGRLEEMAAEVGQAPVRLVKTIGDAAMLASEQPGPLVDAALDLVEAAEQEGKDFPSMHAGLAFGEALPRGGDWYGHPVNLASRITDFSTPGSVVVSKELHDAIEEAGDDGAYRWSNVGKKKLKGIKGQCELYRVRRAESGDGDSDSDSDDD
ncbi:MAG TPA: adenylate cyclase regulatory domain-containing protein, partial [Thermoleophilaceae bacterium]